MLKCCVCKEKDGKNVHPGFASLNDLEAHLVEEHFSNCCIYECPICQYTRFPTEFSLVQHCREFHKDLGKIQLKQSVDLAKLDSRSLIHSSLNAAIFEMVGERQIMMTPKPLAVEKLEKITPNMTKSISQNCTIFHSITPTPSTSKKPLTTLGQECIELSEIAQFTTRTSQQGGIILISPTGYEYRKSKKAANSRGEYIYRCNSMLGYRDCKARVSVDICTGAGILKDQQHNHPPPTDFHNKSNGPLSVAEMFLPGRRSKRGIKKVGSSQAISDDYYDQEPSYNEDDDSSEPLAKREDIKNEDTHPNISSVNDFIYCIAQQK